MWLALSIRNLACFGLALAVTSLAIGARLPLPDLPDVAQKWRYFAAHKDEFDTLFLGSSRVIEQIDPALFDRELADHGVTSRTFNFGLHGLFPPEDSYVLDWILDTGPTRLRTVFVEVSMFRDKFGDQAPETLRAAYWHDWPRTEAVRRVLFADFHFSRKKWRASLTKFSDRGGLYLTHLRLFLRKTLNIGRGSSFLPWRGPVPPTRALGPRADGFPASPDAAEMKAHERAEYERLFAAFQEKPAVRTPLPAGAQANLDRMLARIRAAGARPVLLLSPSVSPLVFVPRREVASVLDFSDAAKWPALFQAEHHRDPGPLNPAGAKIYTSLIAREFLALPEEFLAPAARPR